MRLLCNVAPWLMLALLTGPIAWAADEDDASAIEAREWARCKDRIEVSVGESKVVEVPGKVSHISMTGQDRADFRSSGSGVTVVGYKPGLVSLVAWNDKNEMFQYCVRVVAGLQAQRASPDSAKAPADPSEGAPGSALRSVQIKVGEQAKVFLPNMRRIAVEDPGIVDAAVQDKDNLILKGISPGRTLLVVHQVDVTSQVVVFVRK